MEHIWNLTLSLIRMVLFKHVFNSQDTDFDRGFPQIGLDASQSILASCLRRLSRNLAGR